MGEKDIRQKYINILLLTILSWAEILPFLFPAKTGVWSVGPALAHASYFIAREAKMNDAQELVNLLDDAISLLKTAVVDDIENIRAVSDVKTELYKGCADRQQALRNIIKSTSNLLHFLVGCSCLSRSVTYLCRSLWSRPRPRDFCRRDFA